MKNIFINLEIKDSKGNPNKFHVLEGFTATVTKNFINGDGQKQIKVFLNHYLSKDNYDEGFPSGYSSPVTLKQDNPMIDFEGPVSNLTDEKLAIATAAHFGGSEEDVQIEEIILELEAEEAENT